MRLAVEESGMRLEDVDHINTHGTSTPIGDISEPKAIARLFGDHAKKISLNSTKSMTQTTRFSVFHFLPCILILNLVDFCSGLYYFFFFFSDCL